MCCANPLPTKVTDRRKPLTMSPRGPRETTKVGRILNFGQLGGKTFSLQSAVITAVEDNGQQEEKQGSGYERDCVANSDMESG